MDRKAFLDQEAPVGYIAGVGRGATGFTTGADTGGIKFDKDLIPDEEDSDTNAETVYNHNDQGLLHTGFKDGKLDEADKEADSIYNEVEKRLQSKRRSVSVDIVEPNEELTEKFIDLKRDLANISEFEWQNLPEASDFTKRNKRARLIEQQQRRFYAAPDSLISNSAGINSSTKGPESTDFSSIASSRNKLLGSQLDNILPKQAPTEQDYSEYSEENNADDIQLADIGRGRLILASLRKTEPQKASSWIASARLERKAKNFALAKKYILQGCRLIKRNEEIWLECLEIHKESSSGYKLCRSLSEEALEFNPKSEALWLKAYNFENEADIFSRRKILMRGLEENPTSVALWRELIDSTEENDEKMKILNKAVELCPDEWGFWLTLINNSNYEESRCILNKARTKMKLNYKAWIAAAKLEEREHSEIVEEKLFKFILKGLNDMLKTERIIERNVWIEEAKVSELEGFTKTCRAIIQKVLQFYSERSELSYQDCISEAKLISQTEFPETINQIYSFVTEKFPENINSWLMLFEAFKKSKRFDMDQLSAYYKLSIAKNPTLDLFWLMWAKDVWKISGDIPQARDILSDGLKHIPTSEAIWLARTKIETENKSYESALDIYKVMLKENPQSSARVWYKYIHLLRFVNRSELKELNATEILNLSEEASERFPNSWKIYLQRSQIQVNLGHIELAGDTLKLGTYNCPESADLWIALADLQLEHKNSLILARSTLDKASLRISDNDKIWEAKIKLEISNKNFDSAEQICNQALKKHPKSPLIWKQRLLLMKKASQRRNAYVDALRATDNSDIILLGIGTFFWIENKFVKSKTWFERALSSNPKNGDIWAWIFKFIKSYGRPEELEEFTTKFLREYDSITQGVVWNPINKSIDAVAMEPKEIIEKVSEALIL